jgi:hypothetical protein
LSCKGYYALITIVYIIKANDEGSKISGKNGTKLYIVATPSAA